MQAPTEIPLSEIDADALPRDRSVTDPALMAELEQSVAMMGLRQPIEVWHLHSPRPPFRYGLISGFRRLAACRALGHSTIPAFLRTPSSIPEAMADMVAENEVRSQITPWEKGRFILATVDEGHFETPDAAVAALYPCAHCRAHFQAAVEQAPPRVGSGDEFGLWLCEQHNAVNAWLDKPQFPCSPEALQLRWRTGCPQETPGL